MSRDYDFLKKVGRGAHRITGSWKGTEPTTGGCKGALPIDLKYQLFVDRQIK